MSGTPINDKQIRTYMSLRTQGKEQKTAAAKACISGGQVAGLKQVKYRHAIKKNGIGEPEKTRLQRYGNQK